MAILLIRISRFFFSFQFILDIRQPVTKRGTITTPVQKNKKQKQTIWKGLLIVFFFFNTLSLFSLIALAALNCEEIAQYK
jgi:hypothetical protein